MVAYMSRVLKYEYVRVAQFARPMDSRTMMPMQRMLWIVQKGRRIFFDQGLVVERDILEEWWVRWWDLLLGCVGGRG